MKKIIFSNNSPEKTLEECKRNIFLFFNLHNLWWAINNKKYYYFISKKENIIFPDGNVISKKLKINQERGPSFTRKILFSKQAKNKNHFFIGLNKIDLEKITKITKIKRKNLDYFNPIFIKKIEFPQTEIKKISLKIKKFNPDFVWICIGSPKQDILANQLFNKTKAEKFFCIGAATDFILKKKKEAPKFFRKFGLEWFYRLITDFKYSKLKVWRSFIALKYLGKISLK